MHDVIQTYNVLSSIEILLNTGAPISVNNYYETKFIFN